MNSLSNYLEAFNLDKAECIRIDHNETIIADVYKVIIPNQKPLILKVCAKDKHFYRENLFLKRLDNQLPVPKIIDTLKPSPSLKGALLIEFLEGDIPKEGDWSTDLAYTLGSSLASLHLNKTTGYGELISPSQLTDDAAPSFYEKFEEELAECKPHFSKELSEQCENYFHSNKHLLKTVDGPCIIHKDFRPGNMIVKEGKLQGIIDWSGSKAGFAEQDFCILEHRNWLSHPDYKLAFLEGYESIRPLPNYQVVSNLLRLGRALAIIGWTHKLGMPTGKHQALHDFNMQFLNQFNFHIEKV